MGVVLTVAVSWRLIVFLLALVLFGFLYGVVLDPVVQDTMDPIAEENADSPPAQTNYERTKEMWSLAPVVVTIAGGAYLIRESIWVRGGRR